MPSEIQFVVVASGVEDSEAVAAEFIEVHGFEGVVGTIVTVTGSELEIPTYEVDAEALAKRYAGFVGAEDLTPTEQVAAVASLVPMALDIVDEARDTIERLYEENERLKRLLG